MPTPNALAIPAPIAEAPSVPADLPADCIFCHQHVDPRKNCAWSLSKKWIAHVPCYDEAWFTVGVAEAVSAEASS